jgi:uncharacterized protein (DUF2062 family)
MSSPDSPAPAPVRTFWQRRVRDPIVAQLTQGITPEKIALTVAFGCAFSLFPVLGTTTILCLLTGLALRLNQPIIQLINQALWPLHLPVIYLCMRTGARLFGAEPRHFHIHEMRELFWNHPARFFSEFGVVAFHAIVAWAIVAPFFIAAIYYLTLPIMRSVVRLRAEAAAKALAEHPPEHPVP